MKSKDPACTFPTVCIGASAGGLETFTQLLKLLPTKTGMAFVLIQHLDPTHKSFLTQALAKATAMPVHEITEGLLLEPNGVYVIPPAFNIGIMHGKFTLFARDLSNRRPYMSIDFFLKALAAECGSRAIGVVLSGTANDGTEGLRAIKAENGVTLVQDPKTAKYQGMPQSAVNAEVVDFCLSIPDMAQELVRLSKHPYVTGAINDPLSGPRDAQYLQKIFILLRTSANVDLSEYKPSTIKRRLSRRMTLLKIKSLQEYVNYLQNNPNEITTLATDVLIHVTSFFRDPQVYKHLQGVTFGQLVKNKTKGSSIRIWVTGCASGEEVYSVAIALFEFLGERVHEFTLQIFGSDISEKMIEKARAGFYTESMLLNVSAERLQRFFVKVDEGYRISKLIRDHCIFVRHDLARDPPFSKLDLITCRNVLIYFEPILQKRIFTTFHYCLNQPGYLLLGKNESITSQKQLFATLDKENKIYARAPVTSQVRFSTMQNSPAAKPFFRPTTKEPDAVALDAAKQVDNLLLAQFAPAGVVVNERLDVIQYRGKTGVFLEAPPGQPQSNIFRLVRDGLFTPLKTALSQAKSKMKTITKYDVTFTQGRSTKTCNITVIPFTQAPGSKEPLFLILFEKHDTRVLAKVKGAKSLSKAKKANKASERTAAQWSRELRTTQEYLNTLNEDHQKTNDTLNSANEELVSGNEELQSMNEELETAKEELQSTNEELSTVNDELQSRNQETTQINDDMINLLNSAEIPILILDLNRCIRRFTPRARKIMSLMPGDVGRQIDDFKTNLNVDHLEIQVQEVIDTAIAKELEVQDNDGTWQRLQIRPYKTSDNKITGAVLSLVNIDLLRRAVIDAEWVRDYSSSIVDAIQTPLLVLESQMRIVSANHAYYDFFNTTIKDTEGKSLYELDKGRWNVDSLKQVLEGMVEKKHSFNNMEFSFESRRGEVKTMNLSARPIQSHDGIAMTLLALADITDAKNREQERRQLLRQTQLAKSDADKANLAKDLFLATLSHELRTPLTAMLLQAQMLQRGTIDETRLKIASRAIERAAQTQRQLIEDLLDVSRIVTGKLKMDMAQVDLEAVIRAAVDDIAPLAESKSVTIKMRVSDKNTLVLGDASRLQQVIWNLITNAVKFTLKGGTIIVGLKLLGEFAQIEVIDHGIGITADFLPQVFSRFSQAETSSTRAYGGLGLGLAIVSHIVEMHGGEIKAASEGRNKGATFTVTLPLLKANSKAGIIPDPAKIESLNHAKRPTQTLNLEGLRILVVEDDLGAREALTDILKLVGAEVQAAASGHEATETLKRFLPDVLILDIAMPGEDGYALLRRIRRQSVGEKMIPALALTALAGEADRRKAMEAGFQLHLAKPIDTDNLTGALMKLSGRA